MGNELFRKIATKISSPFRRMMLSALLLLGLGTAGYTLFFPQPKVISPVGASLGITEVSNTKPLVIKFNRPVSKKTLKYEIHPDLKGTWNVTSKTLSGGSTLIFTPSESPALDTRYTIALSGIKSVFGETQENYLLSFQTDAAPILQSVSPADGEVDLLPSAPIVLTLDKSSNEAVEYTVALTPEVQFREPEISENVVAFRHTEEFQKNTSYTVTVFQSIAKVDYTTSTRVVSEEKIALMSSSFTTIAAPGIQAHSPSGSGVDPAATVQIEFQQDMDRPSTESAFSLLPSVAGAFIWENERKVLFTPEQSLAKNQLYTITVAKTAKGVSGLALEEDLSFSFTTIGHVGASLTPSNGATGVDAETSIRVAFDQEVVHASAEASFSITPAFDGSFSWDGNVMVFNPAANLSNNQAYTATVNKGVQSIKGLDSVNDFSTRFTTKTQSVMLSVPAYRQAHMYSCMIAAARGALAFRGVSVSEADIISRVGKDTTPWSGTWAQDGAVWGDPDAGIVGDLDGKSNNIGWGYGAHWSPIAKALTSYGINNEIRSSMTVQDLAQAIADGNPVIVYWVNGVWPAYVVNWETPSGKQVRGVNSLHVQVVRGFTGTVDNPVSFTVTDSGYGYPGRTLDVGTFKAKWGWFGNTGIIVK